MKLALSLVLLFLIPGFASAVAAQDTSGDVPTLADLRVHLLEVQAKETELQARARQLDEDLKPENIERSLAGIGSTRPEELRESRRRQLSIERDSMRAQLKLVTTSRERLESAIRTSETQAYQQSAREASQSLTQTLTAKSAAGSRWVIGMIAGLMMILGLAFVIALIRRRGM